MKDVLSYIYWMYRRESEKGAGSIVLHFHDSLFQVLCQWRTEKRAGDEWGLVGKKERSGEPVSIVLKTLFRYTSYWYIFCIPSDWLRLTVYINTLSVCLKRSDA